ncbi:hypothetical protein HY230_03665 [Candidatus Acetothermia bacterium]|nr:hypothetical protein [Candidatus Acetothermia bacterium]
MADSGKMRVTTYRFTGKQGFFTIPERYCEECDLTIAVTRDVLQELNESRFELVIKPWLKDEIKTALAAVQRALEIISV